ncbi:hypothetical protein V8G54_016422 [Vigna mungo]|uniref:Uncharacterized protein n=1 Tax=Vigna mungo TaxID=3915 RepID=A0AAQ3NMC6_VIGMU
MGKEKPEKAGKSMRMEHVFCKHNPHSASRGRVPKHLNLKCEIKNLNHEVVLHYDQNDEVEPFCGRFVRDLDHKYGRAKIMTQKVLKGPNDVLIEKLLHFNFKTSSNQVGYEAILVSLIIAKEWMMDIIEPFTLCKGQVKFLLVGIDYFTKWKVVEAHHQGQLVCDVDTMIPMEIGEPSLQQEQHNKEHNEDCLNTNLDLLVEKRERAQ